jgi:hypothetical protein
VRRSGLLLQLDAALDESKRLIVPVLHQRHVRLISVDSCEDVSRLDHESEPLCVTQRRHCLIEPPFLRERHAGERVHHREMPPIASRVQRRGSAGDVFANDCRIAYLSVTETEFVVGKSDGARVVGALGLFQRPREKCDTTRGLAAGDRHAAVHAPEIGEARRVETLPLVGRTAEGLGGLAKVVLEEPRLRQGASNLHLVVTP